MKVRQQRNEECASAAGTSNRISRFRERNCCNIRDLAPGSATAGKARLTRNVPEPFYRMDSNATAKTVSDDECSRSDLTSLSSERLSSVSRPTAGSSTHELSEQSSNETGSSNSKERKEVLTWRPVSGNTLLVRSRDYTSSRSKQPSLGELYTCLHVDFLESQARLKNMSSRVKLPAIYETSSEAEEKLWHAPDIFVVSLSIPIDANGGKEDGPSHTITMYFGIKRETRETLKTITTPQKSSAKMPDDPRVAAIRLFNEWCRKAPSDPCVQARFKMIPQFEKSSKLGIPFWIAGWNGKPVLIKRSGTTGFLHTNPGVNCMEFEISLHPFPWAAKQGIDYLRQHVLRNVNLTLGFLIEGREEMELPEVLLGLCQISCLDVRLAVNADEFFKEGRG